MMKRSALFAALLVVGCSPTLQMSHQPPPMPSFLRTTSVIALSTQPPAPSRDSAPMAPAALASVPERPTPDTATPVSLTRDAVPPAPVEKASARPSTALIAQAAPAPAAAPFPHVSQAEPAAPPAIADPATNGMLMKGAPAQIEVPLVERAFEVRSATSDGDPLPSARIPQPFGAIGADALTLLRELARQRGFSVAADRAIQDRTVSLHLDHMPVSRAIDAITRAADLSYSFQDGQLNVTAMRPYTLSLPPLTSKAIGENTAYEDRDEPFYQQIADTLEGFGAQNVRRHISGRLVSFSAGPKAADAIKQYARELREKRVRINYDVWIAEVSATSEDSRGIRWDELSASIGALDIAFSGGTVVAEGYSLATGFVANGLDISAVASFLKRQGDVEVLSNPHVAMISGSFVRLDDTTTDPYLALQPIAPTTDDVNVNVTTGIDTRELTTGIVLTVAGDYQDGLVTTSLHLSLSDLVSFEEFQVEDSSVRLPRSSERTISTQISTPPGATVVLGGISRSASTADDQEVPWLGRVMPYLFSSTTKTQERKQLVIALVPRIARFTQGGQG
ncbi:MAG: hypothetical protein RLO06_18515 [Parvibaculum sp.]